MNRQYDLAVIGSGPAGQRAAIQAAKLGKRTVVIEKSEQLGGAGINTGTIPSKALREAVLYLTGASKRGLFGATHRVKRNISIEDLTTVTDRVIQYEVQQVHRQFDRNHIDLLTGTARFTGEHELTVDHGAKQAKISADKFVIATGTKPARPGDVPFDERRIVCSDSLLEIDYLPRTMIVVGGGVIGTEYACILATLGVRVTLVEAGKSLLSFLDQEIREAFQHEIRRTGIRLRLNEKVESIALVPGGDDDTVCATLASGKELRADTLLYAIGRHGVCDALSLETVGLESDDRGRLAVNDKFQTNVPHIYAAGDIIGFPALASTSMEQGRLAASHAFGVAAESIPTLLPFGIYAVPEISMVGRTEAELTEAGIPYEAGVAHYSELARAQLLGDEAGLLKLLIHQQDHTILGVHCIGTGATELIHIGQMVMTYKGTVHDLLDNVFNYPTLAEAYKVAAYNGVNRMHIA